MTQDVSANNPHRHLFYQVLAITTLIKLWLAIAIPLTGDEAYFYQWGKHLDWGGYYDHPPMAGWILWLLQQFSSHLLVLRLPAILLWIVITLGMMDLLDRMAPAAADKRWMLGSLFLALPFTWSLNLITTDTPLIFFLFFSGYALIRAELADDLRWYAASGVLLGLALLSKYFAGLLAIAYAVYLLPRRGGWWRLLIVALCALPFMLLNLAWNTTHCWNNFLFNLINRNQGAHFTLTHLAIYVAMMIYLVTPWTAWQIAKIKNWHSDWRLAVMFVVPFVLFLFLSFYKSIGLHWVLAFLPFVFLFAAIHMSEASLTQHRRWVTGLGVPHLLALALIAHLPSDYFKPLKIHPDIVMHREAPRLIEMLKEGMPDNGELMTQSYSGASLLAFHSQTYVPVFGSGSFHARFDDNITDFHIYEGRTLRIVSAKRLLPENFTPYFDDVQIKELTLDGASFWMAEGRGFHFEPYYEQVLKKIAETYYRVPSYLPLRGCRFLEQYGFI
ncbi:MAG: hypothetical protein RI928_32 [Pseudomonadota bacterium]|jgi:hypothetical protein